MLELPESTNISRQLNLLLTGRTITDVQAAATPHKFAFYEGDPAGYAEMLTDAKVNGVRSFGGYIEILLQEHSIILGEDLALHYLPVKSQIPASYQLLVEFDKTDILVVTVKMYGALYAIKAGQYTRPQHQAASDKPNPLSQDFSFPYFISLTQNLKSSASVKAFLATEQRIPGLGNGVLQDILFNARLNPKTKISTMEESRLRELFTCLKDTLETMTSQNGRDTEKDIHGNPGGYKTILCAKTFVNPCPACQGRLLKQAYLGGTIYFCPVCQPL